MESQVASLDQQYIESLKLRNELLRQFNSSLQVQISESQARSTSHIPAATAIVPPPPPPPEAPAEVKITADSKVEATSDTTKTAAVVKIDGEESAKVNGDDSSKDGATKTDEADAKKKKRFRVVVNKWNSTSQKWEDLDEEITSKSDDDTRQIVYRRVMNSENERKCDDEECNIPLDGLKTLLQMNMLHVEREWFEYDSIAFDSPFTNIVYNWNQLEQASEEHGAEGDELRESRNDLKLLMSNIRVSEPRRLKAYFKDREAHLRAKTITFGTLWTLFQPGTKVLAKPFMDQWQMFEVQSGWMYYNRNLRDDPDGSEGYERYGYFYVNCAGFDWDGRHFKRYTYRFRFEKFEGRRLINGLICFPEKYWSPDKSPDKLSLDGLKTVLIKRGKKFAKLCTAKKEDVLCKYEGFLLYAIPPRNYREREYRTIKRVIKNQSVIVDNISYMESRRNDINEYMPHPPLGDTTWIESVDCCPCQECRGGPIQIWSGNEFDDPEIERDAFVSFDERLLLCPPKVLGYVPMERLWAQFSVDQLQEISHAQKEEDKRCFHEKLELDEKHKSMLLALVKNHESRKNNIVGTATVQDPISGKGRGLAVLLHGPPGVGKTLTAEAVALATAKPLLFVSVAELGHEPNRAEVILLDMFSDASRWDAVMVIDEADVFLEERIGTTDVNRNALVSVLLRVLEYYDGIIILTTNRITSLDVAVQSRMQLAIQYNDLSEQQKRSIFRKFLDGIPKDLIRDREMIDKQLERVCKRAEVNGRQIRNIVSGALALANAERKKLTYDEISEVYDATADFTQSLKDLTLQKRGRNEAPR